MTTGPTIFDRTKLPMRRQRAQALGPAPFHLDRVADDLLDRLSVALRQFEHGADLETPTDALRVVLLASGKVGSLERARIVSQAGLEVMTGEQPAPFADGSLDLVVSGLALQFVNDLPGALIQIRRALKADGLLR